MRSSARPPSLDQAAWNLCECLVKLAYAGMNVTSPTSSTLDRGPPMTSSIFAQMNALRIRAECPHFPAGSIFIQNIFPRSIAYMLSCSECGLILQSQWVTQLPGPCCLIQELLNLGELSKQPKRRRSQVSRYSQPIIPLSSSKEPTPGESGQSSLCTC